MSTEPNKQIELHLDADKTSGPEMQGAQAESKPVMGWIAVTCAVLGIISSGVIFVPLGFVCSIIALFMGQGMWAFVGLALSVVGLFSSPLLLGILGLGALAAYFGIPI